MTIDNQRRFRSASIWVVVDSFSHKEFIEDSNVFHICSVGSNFGKSRDKWVFGNRLSDSGTSFLLNMHDSGFIVTAFSPTQTYTHIYVYKCVRPYTILLKKRYGHNILFWPLRWFLLITACIIWYKYFIVILWTVMFRTMLFGKR